MEQDLRVNDTMKTFGYPETLVADYAHWAVLLRPKQPTLGSLVLVCKEPAASFSEISEAAFRELKRATSDIETALAEAFAYDKINYLMLMMVDPDVHFHVLPRYAEDKTFGGVRFPDPGWPRVPDLTQTVDPDDALRDRLIAFLRDRWPAGHR